MLRSTSEDTSMVLYSINEQAECLNCRLESIESKTTANTVFPTIKLSTLKGEPVPPLDVHTHIPRTIIPYGSLNHDVTNIQPFDYLKAEKCIVLLNDAGFGKTYVMYQIYYEATNRDYHPIFCSLKTYNEESVLSLLAKGLVAPDKTPVFILDGFDEMEDNNRNHLIHAIYQVRGTIPDVMIIISSRTNLYTNQIDEFKKYAISPLGPVDYKMYLSNSDINYNTFMQRVHECQLDELCKNVFYFIELGHIFRSEGQIVSSADVMDRIINARIQDDSSKFSHTRATLLQHVGDIITLLERAALVMQCIHRQELTSEELVPIQKGLNSDLSQYDGLWICLANGNWSFSHNNFREYFAASLLSKKPLKTVLRLITDGFDPPKVKPYWYNTLSFLAVKAKGYDLFDWISNNQPELLFVFEKDRLRDEDCTGILIRIIEKHKQDRSWLNIDHSNGRQLATLCGNRASIQYLLHELTTSITHRQKQNVIRCLNLFDSFYSLENDLRITIKNIAFDENEPNYVRADAFRLMETNAHLFFSHIKEAAEICYHENDTDLRYAILSYIFEAGRIEDCFELIIKEISHFNRDSGFISFQLLVDRVVSSIQRESSAYQLLSYFYENRTNIYGTKWDQYFETCCDVGIANYSGTNDRILKCLLQLTEDQLFCLTPIQYDHIRRYMIGTHTETVFLKHITEHTPDLYCGYVLARLICKTLTELICTEYSKGSIDNSLIERVVYQLPTDNTCKDDLIRIVYRETGIFLHIEKQSDPVKKREEDFQRFFDSLFDKECFMCFINKLADLFGYNTRIMEKVTGLPHEKTTILFNDQILLNCFQSLHRYFPDSSTITYQNIEEGLSNWDLFRFYSAVHALTNSNFAHRFCQYS